MATNEDRVVETESDCLHWSVISSVMEGEVYCGDAYVINEYENKNILMGVIDGLGHGFKAAEASQKASAVLTNGDSSSLLKLIKNCHHILHYTRGAVMGLALINPTENILRWIGIGNITGVLASTNKNKEIQIEKMIQRGGIVGYQLPVLQESSYSISKGDMLIFSTDGVDQNYLEQIEKYNEPDAATEYIASNFFKQSDDALILVAKYEG